MEINNLVNTIETVCISLGLGRHVNHDKRSPLNPVVFGGPK